MSLTTDLVSYWKLDTSNNTQPDSVGSNDITVEGGTYNASGKINGCYKMDGGDGSGMDTGWTGLDTSASHTYSFWSKDSNTLNVSQMIKQTPKADNEGARIYAIGTNKIYAKMKSGGISYYAKSNQVYTANVWHFVVYTYDETNMKIYVDGVLQQTTEATGYNDITNNVLITRALETYDNNFDGYIDEIGMWERALTYTEVKQLYNAGHGLQYPFDRGLQINIGDTWKKMTDAKINIGDTWKDVDSIKINIGDSWKGV